MNQESLAKRLLATFATELEEQVRALNADLLALETDAHDAARLKAVFRAAHTLKGAARAAGVPLVEQVCHALESRLADARDGRTELGARDFTLLYRAADALADAGGRLQAGRNLESSPLAALHESLTAGSAKPPVPATSRQAAPLPQSPEGGTTIRVDAAKLDALVIAAGQLLVTRGRLGHHASEGAALYEEMSRRAAAWRRAGRELRLACDAAGLGRLATQLVDQLDQGVAALLKQTDRLTAGLARDAGAFVQIIDDVRRSVGQLRMRPFADACEPLPRTVRDLAAAAGKEARLDILGGEVEMDRAIVDGMREALLQLIRNAMDHGIETPAERERSGKPRAGALRVMAALRGDRVVITVADDGRGLETAVMRRHLERRGVPPPADDGALSRLLFAGGVSTRAEATSVSGRGVGLDIVRAAVERIRGTVDVHWEAGRGTTFTIECPPTLVSIRAVLIGLGPHVLAVPSNRVERLLRLDPAEIPSAEGRPVVKTEDGPVPLVGLGRLLGLPFGERPAPSRLPVVLLGAGGRRAGIAVDDLLSEQEVVLRPAGRIAAPRFASGVTLLDTGRVAPILDVDALVTAALEGGGGRDAALAQAAASPTGGAARQRVLVVDDSITTRTLEQSLFEAAGYDVRTAVDGADAWKLLQEHGADLVVADIEMPRMDGFALCEAIRGSKRFRELPVVLVTALETAEHRARGLAVGADAYFGKSSFDQQSLLDTVRQLLD